jgi:dihydroorotase
VATRLGLPGIPASAETVIIGRDLALIEEVGVRAHFCRLSTGRGAEMVAEARDRGLTVSADVSAHQLHLNERHLGEFDSLYHLNPPLRTEADMIALREAVHKGWVEAICSDHQPHEEDAKQNPFGETEPGISSLETLMSLALLLADTGIPVLTVLERLTRGPAQILSLASGTLEPGAPADICIFDPQAKELCDPDMSLSRGKNTPFKGWELPGRVTHTLVGGRLVYKADSALGRSAA